MTYELYYWPSIQGRGEFVRLALEDAGADYEDVARGPRGTAAIRSFLEGLEPGTPPLAPPFLRHGDVVVAQTANVLAYLGPRLGLSPADEPGRVRAQQVMLTVMDLVAETHETHHPVAAGLYYDQQKPEAMRRSQHFTRERMPKYLGWLERLIERDGHLVSPDVTYADLAAFQVVEGLRYAFPRAMAGVEPKLPHLVALRDRIAGRPRLSAYLASPRRLPFNEHGIFRRYPELDEA